MSTNFKEDLSKVKAFIFDVDGVFTDGNVVLTESGEMQRTMNLKDGLATFLTVQKGYPICIISGGTSEAVRKRFEGLGVSDVYLGSRNKVIAYKEFKEKYKLSDDEILYMGDDLIDYGVMTLVGVPTCPKDAVPEIKSIAKYISDMPGGKGCVRDVLEQVLRAQENWFDPEKEARLAAKQ